MQIFGIHQCGGSIISSKRVLTAAHCTNYAPAFLWTIRAGSLNYSSGGQLLQVESIAQHADYNETTLANDISILKLAEELNMRMLGVRAIKLPAKNASLQTHALASVAGWGITAETGSNKSIVLRQVKVPIVSQRQCNKWYNGSIDQGMLCAGYVGGAKDSCTYDSGGPLTLDNRLIGVVSWGAGCARKQKPGVYTRVAYFRDWINKNV